MQRVLVIGAGFAGMWAALGAARRLDLASRATPQEGRSPTAAGAAGAAGTIDPADVEVVLIAPVPDLHLRSRLHEADPGAMTVGLMPLFGVTGVRYVQGRVTRISFSPRRVEALDAHGHHLMLDFDRLVLTSGSQAIRPPLPGLSEFGHSIDQLDEAIALQAHLQRLADAPSTPARDTVVVVGGGFTGIEVACELPARLRAIWGEGTTPRVILLEQAREIGPELGQGPRPVIESALRALDVEVCVATSVARIDGEGLWTDAGQRIESRTVIWTAGLRASGLTQQLSDDCDAQGRLPVGDDLRVFGHQTAFAAGDVARAVTDEAGHVSLMSCQHALRMGRVAGHNAMADLLGEATIDYRQRRYVTCLDLGEWGAVLTDGWQREVKLSGAPAKAIKRQINTQRIYPPVADRAVAFAAAAPDAP